MQCEPYLHVFSLVQNCHWGWGEAAALVIWSGPSPCAGTHWHNHQCLDCNKKIWNLTAPLFDADMNCSSPNRVLSKLKNTHKGTIYILTSHQGTPRHWCFEVLCLCLNVSMVKNAAEISGTWSTDRNIFCNSFLKVIPNPCCLHTLAFSVTIKDNFSCWQMPYNITRQSLFWTLVSQNSQSSSGALLRL